MHIKPAKFILEKAIEFAAKYGHRLDNNYYHYQHPNCNYFKCNECLEYICFSHSGAHSDKIIPIFIGPSLHNFADISENYCAKFRSII